MKLLFDHNLSPRLVRLLGDVYPGSVHVHDIGMDRASDTEVWRYAGENGFMIVTKDADFHQRSLLFGPPPKVVWLQIGNCTVDESAAAIRRRYLELARFAEQASSAFVIVT